MKPLVVTFDCANTLVRVRWTPGGFALDCARAVGLELGPTDRSRYEQMLRSRWGEYRQVNEARDPVAGDDFWRRLTEDWLKEGDHPSRFAGAILEVAPDLLYGRNSTQFALFEDVVPCLDSLDQLGLRLAVISNWDYSLHRVLKALGVYDRFEIVIASLEEGVEKPDPRLFHLSLEKLGVEPREALHVGDDPVDDLQGARRAGLQAWLIDRDRTESRPPYLLSLVDLERHLASVI